MNPTLRLHPRVLTAREVLAEGREKLRQQHDANSPGLQLGYFFTNLLDTVVLQVYAAAVEAHSAPNAVAEGTALVAHGGYGRRDAAPFSDVDLMLLHHAHITPLIHELASRLVQDLSDVGLDLGFSVRTPQQSYQLAMRDPVIFSSLVESRYLAGSESLFQRYLETFRRRATRRSANASIKILEQARIEERLKYGETVYLLEPNVKRSRGGLRDIHLLRWIGFVAYGESDPAQLQQLGYLSVRDQAKLRDAHDFLLRLRNDLHFQACGSQDVLTKPEQLRIAELRGYEGDAGLIPVERFMQHYFHHTTNVRNVVGNFVASAKWNSPIRMAIHNMFGLKCDNDFLVGPRYVSANRNGYKRVKGNLVEVLRLMELSSRYSKRIDHDLWQVIRESMAENDTDALGSVPTLFDKPLADTVPADAPPRSPTPDAVANADSAKNGRLLSPEVVDSPISKDASELFLTLLAQPGHLGMLLRRLHELHVLDKLIPGWSHARCLLQFNEYHKYTVDEHSFRAVERATEFLHNDALLGRVYRKIQQKATLHLALLIHDVGKGYAEDHSEVGRRIAIQVARHLNLNTEESDRLVFLVHRHLMLNHLAFRRDNSDESILLEVASEIGSPENLRMLFVLSCADLAAVGPGVLNQWKIDVLSSLYERVMETLGGGTAMADLDQRYGARRDRLRVAAAESPDHIWLWKQIEALPPAYLQGSSVDTVLDDLRQLKSGSAGGAVAWGRYLQEREISEYLIGAREDVADGIFHRLTGAITSQGLEILSAEIHSLADSMFLDKFCVRDPDFDGPPTQKRFDAVSQRLVDSLLVDHMATPVFRRVWRSQRDSVGPLTALPTQIKIDNTTSDRCTILDVFAHDQTGLLFAIARSLFEQGLSVQIAKIGTYLDQVVDVFYVTDREGRKIEDEVRLAEIRSRLYHAIQSWDGEA